MQFNSHATGQDIVTFANEKARQTTATYPLTTKALHANEAMRVILELIHDSYGGWRYDDRNQTDLPSSTTDLESGQRNYALPTDAVGLAAVFVKNQGGDDDDWVRLKALTFEEIPGAEPSYERTAGQPHSYRALNNSIVLYPPASYTETDGLRIEYDRDVVAFASTDTTKTPGFDPSLHEAVPAYMALQYAQARQLPSRDELRKAWEGDNGDGGWVGRIKRHYGRKFRDMFPPRIRADLPINGYL